MKKIKFVANYDTDLNIYKSIRNCFPLSEEDISMLTFKDDYDYLGIINGLNRAMNITKDRTIGFLQEPIGNINYHRNLDNYCSTIYCQNKSAFKDSNQINIYPLCMFYSNHTFYHHDNFKKTSFNKPKKICIFVSSLAGPNNVGWHNHNYSKRHALVDKILKSDLDIDIYGRGWNISDRRYKGSPLNKHEMLSQYSYSIGIENVCEENYVSEKFFDCILNKSVPLYYGCPNVNEIFNKECYAPLNLDDDNVIEQVKNIISSDTAKYQQAILDAGETYFRNLNPFSVLRKHFGI